jgi:predicted acetyltransferase
VDLFLAVSGEIHGMADIKLNAKNHKSGLGTAVVKSLVATAEGNFHLYDIQKMAVGFWKKMGAVFPGSGKDEKAVNGVDGVIRKTA